MAHGYQARRQLKHLRTVSCNGGSCCSLQSAKPQTGTSASTDLSLSSGTSSMQFAIRGTTATNNLHEFSKRSETVGALMIFRLMPRKTETRRSPQAIATEV